MNLSIVLLLCSSLIITLVGASSTSSIVTTKEKQGIANDKNLIENCYLINPDSTISGLGLHNRYSVKNILGSKIKINDSTTYLLNKDKSQYLNTTVYLGGYYNQISVFEVGYTTKEMKKLLM